MKLYIKELREAKGLTQKELADLLQVSFQTVSKWENGVNFPDITQIPRMADIFGVSSDIILGLEPLQKEERIKYDEVGYWNDKRELIKVWKKLYWNDDYFRFFIRDVLKFSGPVNMIDFGCGYGYLGTKLMPLLAEGSSYTGVELDQGQIDEAEGIFSKTSYKYKFIKENIYDFQPKEQYDFAVAMLLLSYMPQPEKLLQKMKECLKPDGTILLIDVNMEVEQAGYFSGLEQEENGLARPDFVPVWECEAAKGERDYRMGTKLPYLLKRTGFKNINARMSDQVIIYEPADENKRTMNENFRYVYSNEDSYKGGLNYFMNRGCSLQKAKDIVEYYNRSAEYFENKDSLSVKTSGFYFVYATV